MTHKWQVVVNFTNGKTIVGETLGTSDEQETVLKIVGCDYYGIDTADGMEWINMSNVDRFRLDDLGEAECGVTRKLFGAGTQEG